MKILVLNAGSSSQKSCLYEIADEALPTQAPKPVWEGKVNWTQDHGVAEIEVKTAIGATVENSISGESPEAHLAYMLNTHTCGEHQSI